MNVVYSIFLLVIWHNYILITRCNLLNIGMETTIRVWFKNQTTTTTEDFKYSSNKNMLIQQNIIKNLQEITTWYNITLPKVTFKQFQSRETNISLLSVITKTPYKRVDLTCENLNRMECNRQACRIPDIGVTLQTITLISECSAAQKSTAKWLEKNTKMIPTKLKAD